MLPPLKYSDCSKLHAKAIFVLTEHSRLKLLSRAINLAASDRANYVRDRKQTQEVMLARK